MTTFAIIICSILLLAAVGFYLLGLSVKRKIDQRVEVMKQRITAGTKVRGQIEMALFSSKEYQVWLYDHYKSLVDVLDQIELDDYETIDKATDITVQGMQTVEDNFIECFGITPDQYRNQKIRMTLHNKKANKQYPSGNFGVN